MVTPIQNQPLRPSEQPNETTKTPPACEVSPFAKTLSQVKSDRVRSDIYASVMESSARYHLPPELILAVIRQESGFRPNATSHCGASGLMQLMPQTAKDLGVTQRYDIRQNIDGGSRYLREMLDRNDGDLEKALAAYNAGPSSVEKYGGVPPFEETQNYVASIQSHLKELGGLQDVGRATDKVLADLSPAVIDLVPSQPETQEPSFGHLRRRV